MLVERALYGHDVPQDVRAQLAGAQEIGEKLGAAPGAAFMAGVQAMADGTAGLLRDDLGIEVAKAAALAASAA